MSTATYDPYGNLMSSTGTQPLLGYQGQLSDAETSLIYLRARWYDPATGQFLTQDPLADLTGEPYAYAGDNPVNDADPTGQLFGFDSALGAAVGGIVGGVAGAGAYLFSTATGARSFSLSGLAASTAGGVIGGAVAGGCIGTTWVAIAGCGAVGGLTAATVTSLLNGSAPSANDLAESAAFGAVGGVVGAKLFPLRGFRPYKLNNILNPGINATRLYGQGVVGGAAGLAPSLFGSAPAYGDARC